MFKYILASILGVIGSGLYYYYGFLVNDNKLLRLVLAIPVVILFIKMLFNDRSI